LTDLQRILNYQISQKSIQWEPSCSMQTDMTQLVATFHSFSNVPKNEHLGQCDIHKVLRKLLHWMENTNSPIL